MKQLSFLIGLLATTQASGLDCVALPQLDAFRTAYTVFQGTVTSLEGVGGTIDTSSGPVPVIHMEPGSGVVATFRVRRGWKGPVTSVMRLFLFEHPQQGSGYSFHKDEEYIVYANNEVRQDWNVLRPFTQKGVVYGIGPCPRIRTDLGSEEKKLGPGHVPHK
jgi:hypothetical protein